MQHGAALTRQHGHLARRHDAQANHADECIRTALSHQQALRQVQVRRSTTRGDPHGMQHTHTTSALPQACASLGVRALCAALPCSAASAVHQRLLTATLHSQRSQAAHGGCQRQHLCRPLVQQGGESQLLKQGHRPAWRGARHAQHTQQTQQAGAQMQQHVTALAAAAAGAAAWGCRFRLQTLLGCKCFFSDA